MIGNCKNGRLSLPDVEKVQEAEVILREDNSANTFRGQRLLAAAVGLFLLAVVGRVDYLTGKELSLSVFYLLPISLVTWYTGRGTGIVFAVLSSALEFYANIMAGLAYTSRYNPYWNILVQLAFYCTFVLMLSLLKAEYAKKTSLVRDLQEALSELKAVEEDLMRKKEALADSNRDLEQFAYVAAHDLKSPLISVEGYLMRLGRKYRENPDQGAERIIGHALDSVIKMRSLISDLLSYARLGANASEFKPTDCNIVFQTVLENLQTDIANAGAVVSHDELPTVIAKDTLLMELFQNLVSNGIKFCTTDKPVIHASAFLRDGEWIFSVRDNGMGIAPENEDRIFQMFERLHRDPNRQGSGIGLAVCKKIVETHGGRIWLESEIGRGSTFFFSIPAKMEQSLSIQQESAAS